MIACKTMTEKSQRQFRNKNTSGTGNKFKQWGYNSISMCFWAFEGQVPKPWSEVTVQLLGLVLDWIKELQYHQSSSCHRLHLHHQHYHNHHQQKHDHQQHHHQQQHQLQQHHHHHHGHCSHHIHDIHQSIIYHRSSIIRHRWSTIIYVSYLENTLPAEGTRYSRLASFYKLWLRWTITSIILNKMREWCGEGLFVI